MSLVDDLKDEVGKIFKDNWATRNGQIVPSPEDLQLSNDAVKFERATVLYADLAGSTKMVDQKKWYFAAEVYKSYLHCAAKIIRSEGGAITSYDGDRVMGIFIGDYQSTSAAKCGLKINYAVHEILNPTLKRQYPSSEFVIRQVVGIDTSPIHAARTGVRGGNDIVWVGRAANYAAKLTELNLKENTWITGELYKKLADEAKFSGDKKESMWKSYKWSQNGDISIYGSTWWWKI